MSQEYQEIRAEEARVYMTRGREKTTCWWMCVSPTSTRGNTFPARSSCRWASCRPARTSCLPTGTFSSTAAAALAQRGDLHRFLAAHRRHSSTT